MPVLQFLAILKKNPINSQRGYLFCSIIFKFILKMSTKCQVIQSAHKCSEEPL